MKDRIYNAAKLQAALEALDRREIETSHVFANTGLERAQLPDHDLRVSASQIIQAFRNISEKFWHPHLAYEIGKNLHISSYGLYGYAVLCSVNYRDTVEFAQKFHFLAAPTANMNFIFDQGAEGWEFEPTPDAMADRDFYAFLVNLQIGIYNSLHTDVVGAEFHSPLIEVRYDESSKYLLPSDAASRIKYGARENRFNVPAGLLELKLELGNQLTFKQVVRICETELSELAQQDGVAGQVKRALIQNAAFSDNMETVSNHLGLTSRTLRRHLKREETTFSEIVDSVRTELALKYLRKAELSTEEIAHVLGFSETASFVRAFRRWTGSTPKSFRVSI